MTKTKLLAALMQGLAVMRRQICWPSIAAPMEAVNDYKTTR